MTAHNVDRRMRGRSIDRPYRMHMNRREFLLFTNPAQNTAKLSCEQLYMRYLDSTLDGSTSQLFRNIEANLSTVTSLHLTDTAWLNCEELKPFESILASFRERGGSIEYKV
jgi:hypothetical protein